MSRYYPLKTNEELFYKFSYLGLLENKSFGKFVNELIAEKVNKSEIPDNYFDIYQKKISQKKKEYEDRHKPTNTDFSDYTTYKAGGAKCVKKKR